MSAPVSKTTEPRWQSWTDEAGRKLIVFPKTEFELHSNGMLRVHHKYGGEFWLTKEETNSLIAWVKDQTP